MYNCLIFDFFFYLTCVAHLYVVANVEEQASEYHGMWPDSEVLLTEIV